MLAFLRFIVSSLGLGKNKWQVNVHLSLDSQYRIRLSGLCSSAQVRCNLLPLTGDWSRNECPFFDHLCNLTIFILEVISKLYDGWKLLLFRWAESNRFCEVNLEMMHTESSEQKDRTWLFELYLRVGQRIYRMSVYSVVLMGIVYRFRCWHAAWYSHLLTGDLCPTCCAAEPAVPHFLFGLSSATYAELIWRRKGKFVRMMKNSFYSFKSMFSFGNSNAKEHIWK